MINHQIVPQLASCAFLTLAIGCAAPLDGTDPEAIRGTTSDDEVSDLRNGEQALSAAASIPGDYGWLWYSESTTLEPAYSHNSWGETNTVEHTGVGKYLVHFPKLGTDTDLRGLGPERGNIQVGAYGSNARCKIMSSTLTISDRIDIDVWCYTPGGALRDSKFVASFYQPGSEDSGGHLVANKPTTPFYVVSPDFSWSREGGTHTVERLGTGAYRVIMNGVGIAIGIAMIGSVLVTASQGPAGSFCKVNSFSFGTSSQIAVIVGCYGPSGANVDNGFSFNYTRYFVPSPRQYGGYVYAASPTVASYQPLRTHWFDTLAIQPTATRQGTGTYQVSYPPLDSGSTAAQVTAVGWLPVYCNIMGWNVLGTTVAVQCYDAAGTTKDSIYMQRYLTN